MGSTSKLPTAAPNYFGRAPKRLRPAHLPHRLRPELPTEVSQAHPAAWLPQTERRDPRKKSDVVKRSRARSIASTEGRSNSDHVEQSCPMLHRLLLISRSSVWRWKIVPAPIKISS